jgi:predicted transcriptional regulator of viral defense system
VSLAARQGGFFTAHQATKLGYSPRVQHHHAHAENWKRVERGLYRLPDWPTDPNENFLFATLWTRELGVISHESALAFFQMGDLMPGEIHVTVPRGFRKRPIPGIVLHRADLQTPDTLDHGGFRTTTPARTLSDVARNEISPEHLTSAIASALERGLIRETDIREAALDLPNSPAVHLRAALNAAKESL